MADRGNETKIFVYENKDVWSILKEVTSDKELDEPFMLVNLNDVIQKHLDWKKAFPNIATYYAVKCNENIKTIKTLAALGVNFDCASKNEIDLVLGLGVDPNRIIYANPNKSRSYLSHAEKVGVYLMTFDSETELYKIKELFPRAKLVIRIKCDDPKLKIKFGEKFGVHHDNEAPKLLATAKKLNLDVIGVCFHIGTGGYNPPIFEVAIKYSRKVFDHAKMLGYNLSLLDIGGGFPGHEGYKLDELAQVVNNALDKYFSDTTIEVIAEPGRYYVASAFTVAGKIIAKHQTKREEEGTITKHNKYHMNEGVFASFNTVLYNRVYEKPSLKPYPKDVELVLSSVWGPTCAGLDQVSCDVELPELEVDEWLFYENMGAYSRSMCTTFNGFPFTKELSVIDKKFWDKIKDNKIFNQKDFVITNSIKNF